MYIVGNPLIAQTMIRHNIQVGLKVPVRILIYEDDAAKTGRIINRRHPIPHTRVPITRSTFIRNDDWQRYGEAIVGL